MQDATCHMHCAFSIVHDGVMKLTDVIRRPLMTEKTSILREDGRTIVFQVASSANKIEIKRAVEQLLGSKVDSIRTSIAHGKVKRQGRFAGRRSDWKKAYVKLREGAKMPEFLEERNGAWQLVNGELKSPSHQSIANSRFTMPIRKYNPTSPGQRFQTVQTFDEITTNEPYKPLIEPLHSTGGRNNRGQLTSWWRGGGHKRMYRIIDFKRDKRDIPAKVSTIEYDPNRSARIALLTYADGEKRYILQPAGLKVGETIVAGQNVDILPGNSLPLKNIPLGTQVHNVELRPGKGGQIARSAGLVGAARRQGRRIRVGEDAVGRDSARSSSSALRRSARSATSITRTCRSARPAGAGGWVSGRTCAAWR